MTPRQMRRAAASLQKWAKIMRDSEIIRYPGHHRYRKFDDDQQGKKDENEYNGMIADAKALRELAKEKAIGN